MRKAKGYWDVYENCYDEAKLYKTRSEFCKGCSSAYYAARRNGWLKDYTWFKESRKQKSNGYWIYENCYEEAKKYQTKTEFCKGCGSAYDAAWKNKWLDDYTWFVDGKIKTLTDKNDSVYKYVFEDGAIYIGRTLISQQKRRHDKHSTSEKDTVFRYAKENGLEVPQMEIIEENITPIEGLKREDYWVNYYKENGYNVINKAKTGIGCGSLGAINSGKWNKENVFAEARKYKTRSEFKKACQSAYNVAWKKGWLDDYTWFKEVYKHWDKENVFEEAKKYKSRLEFQKSCNRAYVVAWKNKWLDILFPKKVA